MSGLALLGAGGRVGRLLSGWRPEAGPVWRQSRSPAPGVDLVCEPGQPDAQAALTTWLTRRAPRAVVCLWGATSGDEAALAANTRLTLLALEAAQAAGVGHVIAMSSAAVYAPRAGAVPRREADAASAPATGAYGRSKLAAERAALDWHGRAAALRVPGPPPSLSLLRLANVVGADMLAAAIRRAGPGAPLALDRFADGRTPRRSYLAPGTLAAALEALAAAPPPRAAPEILNLADGGAVEMSAILDALAAAGRPVPWHAIPAPPRAVAELALDGSAFADRCPAIAAGFRRGAPALVADWLAAEAREPA